MPTLEDIEDKIQDILDTGMITNSKYVKELEKEVAHYIGVKECIAVSSCTLGLILTLKCLDIKGKIAIPSYTFSATAHACVWNGLEPILVDCKRDTFNIDPEKIPKDVDAIMGVHVFGNPCDVFRLQEVAEEREIPLLFDAAHGFGAAMINGEFRMRATRIGQFGEAEVFSCSPTKPLCAVEGGLITTNNEELAEKLQKARNYGYIAPDYDCKFNGLNARMGEFNAIIGLWNLKHFDEHYSKRLGITQEYWRELCQIEGVKWQRSENELVKPARTFAGLIIEGKADKVHEYLTKNGIESKRYFYPPLHEMTLYKDINSWSQGYYPKSRKFPNTEYVSHNNLTLPLYPTLKDSEVKFIIEKVKEGLK